MRLQYRQGPSSLYTFLGRHMKRPKFTREQLIAVVRESTSMRQVLTRLNVAPYGGNYDVLRRSLKRLDISTAHCSLRPIGAGADRGLARYCSHLDVLLFH